MLKMLRERGRRLLRSRPGRRFQDYYDWNARNGRARAATRLAELAASFLLLAAGLVMLITPGPGILAILLGLALLAGRACWLARLLDRTELQLRRVLARFGVKLPA